jgi:hypothetical protein
METTYYGNATAWYHGNPPGPWIMTDQENNLVGLLSNPDGANKLCGSLPNIRWRFVTAMAKGEPHPLDLDGRRRAEGPTRRSCSTDRASTPPMTRCASRGRFFLGNGGDNSDGSQGTFYRRRNDGRRHVPHRRD